MKFLPAVIILISFWSCQNSKIQSSKIPETSPSPAITEQVQLTPNDQIRADAKILIEKLDTLNLDIFKTFTLEDIGYKLSVYKTDQSYSVYCYNDPVSKISCLTGMQNFVNDFGLSQHFSADHYQYHLEQKGNVYELTATSLTEPVIALDKLAPAEYATKYKGKFGDPFAWINSLKTCMKNLALKRAGASNDQSRYSFTMTNNATLFYYPNGVPAQETFSQEGGEWLEPKKYYLLF